MLTSTVALPPGRDERRARQPAPSIAATQPSLTLVVCSNRPVFVERYWRRNIASLGWKDTLLVVLDVAATPEACRLAQSLRDAGVECVLNGANLGLAACRNTAIRRCQTDHLVFVDDEVTISKPTIADIRRAFGAGAGIVGVRIQGPEAASPLPWCISDAQLHYLAIHTDRTLATWGACMGFDLRQVRRHALVFRDELGRRGTDLASADDTTFVNGLRDRGIAEAFLTEHFVHHNVDAARLSFRYVLRRAYWQGRSEHRRRTPWPGIKKEWRRNAAGMGLSPRRMLLAITYTAAVAAGIVREAGSEWQHRSQEAPSRQPRLDP